MRHHRAGRFAKAETLYRALLEDEPDEAEALHRLGVLVLTRGDAATAAGLLRRAALARPDDAGVQNSFGAACRAVGQPAEAERCYRRALEIDPASVQARFNLANALAMQSRVAEAVEERSEEHTSELQ